MTPAKYQVHFFRKISIESELLEIRQDWIPFFSSPSMIQNVAYCFIAMSSVVWRGCLIWKAVGRPWEGCVRSGLQHRRIVIWEYLLLRCP